MSTQGATHDFGFEPNTVVQEFYWDEDVDPSLRDQIAEQIGSELVDEDYSDMVDGAIIWWRAEDGDVEDLTDLLVDALSNLENGGQIWVLTPKAGLDQHVSPAEISEAAKVAGLSTTSAKALGSEWSGMRLAARKRQ
ncbi:hypothetical protein BSR29_06035 [Boudabousia liubingyangii]|uniref:DUF3052 domain-containing protein n=1 Tax=Boudabousia liubingyangii TaxID=1921764 RepID=A0A1Q5PKL9_9ACTO|nr:DUF3052 domain-containing protein [Boudabousia liubingyangii]OKL46499.1 hypothetical protein BSR28_08245 [Boudabousia liubingyangii]OKL47179.1 hypothetical protein BSR29_06035 [Boudabousia liubingyangii]